MVAVSAVLVANGGDVGTDGGDVGVSGGVAGGDDTGDEMRGTYVGVTMYNGALTMDGVGDAGRVGVVCGWRGAGEWWGG